MWYVVIGFKNLKFDFRKKIVKKLQHFKTRLTKLRSESFFLENGNFVRI